MASVPGSNAGSHAHLLGMEMGGSPVRETPTEVIDEVKFRETYVSSLMQEMFRETQAHIRLEAYESWD